MQRVGFLISPNFQLMSFAALSAFEFANYAADKALYDIAIVSESGGPVRSSVGPTLDSLRFDEPEFDTLVVCGTPDVDPPTPDVVGYVRRAPALSRRVASICTGAFVLAEAGLLDGRRVTTHWLWTRDLQARFPRLKVDEDRIFIADGQIWTSAGMSAGVDLALGMVEEDHGAELARIVARQLVLYHRRGGGQSQHSNLLDLDAKSDRIQTALTYARRNLHTPLSVEQLAEVAHLSPRQFSRAFRAETGQSPAKAVENLRVEAARLMMEQTLHPIDIVARETGFADRERMRRAFLRAFGQPPQAIRRLAKGAAA
ncbi:AraC family transcriptional regulator [Labrys okinawensis]|uniref:AraC family transcriptional regulator n=1 Tax=Labrys okinawensis TaxID=346911 RepID=A0A2S9Q4A0_9HYPH|nr:GlxA family transcriptional regulator [Labrys okinawensis]PRH84140.1 AraC family transcriptional regulator [Labrys okinawensis]